MGRHEDLPRAGVFWSRRELASLPNGQRRREGKATTTLICVALSNDHGPSRSYRLLKKELAGSSLVTRRTDSVHVDV